MSRADRQQPVDFDDVLNVIRINFILRKLLVLSLDYFGTLGELRTVDFRISALTSIYRTLRKDVEHLPRTRT